MANIRFHLDEHVALQVAAGLRRRGIDITTTGEIGLISATDKEQLDFSYRDGRVVVTHDRHFPILHASGAHHAGIAYCTPEKYTLGELIQAVQLLFDCYTAEEMIGRIEYL